MVFLGLNYLILSRSIDMEIYWEDLKFGSIVQECFEPTQWPAVVKGKFCRDMPGLTQLARQ